MQPTTQSPHRHSRRPFLGLYISSLIFMLIAIISSVATLVLLFAPVQVMVRACQNAAINHLFNQPEDTSGNTVMTSMVEFMPLVQAQNATIYTWESSASLGTGYTPPDAFDDSNGPEQLFNYSYTCTIEYTGNRFWGTQNNAKVIDLQFELLSKT